MKERRLSTENREKLQEIRNKTTPYEDKVGKYLTYTVEEVQQHVDFKLRVIQLKDIPKDERVNYYLKIKPEFTIELEYTNGKGNYTISQSQVLGKAKTHLATSL